jgi:glycosyltransferase involved in cell wall biosynthesis
MLTLVIPAYNEASLLSSTVPDAVAALDNTVDHSIHIVDNASTDQTYHVAKELAGAHDVVTAQRIEQRGKARAIRAGWNHADTPVLAFVDADLSPDIAALPSMARRVKTTGGLAITSRHSPTSTITWSTKRRLLSKAYNAALNLVAGTDVHDHQCGLKCVHEDFYQRVHPLRSTEWFLDTELILDAHHESVPIDEYAIRWEDRDDGELATTSVSTKLLRALLTYYNENGFSRHGTSVTRHQRTL